MAGRAAALHRVDHPVQVLLDLADVLVHHLQEVDAVEIALEFTRDHLRRHCLSGIDPLDQVVGADQPALQRNLGELASVRHHAPY